MERAQRHWRGAVTAWTDELFSIFIFVLEKINLYLLINFLIIPLNLSHP
jgi:hypothetical protein